MLLLALFLFRANRQPAAWWVWLPIGVNTLIGTPLVWLVTDGEQSLVRVFYGFAVSLGAVWLLTPLLESRHRISTFLKTVLVLVGFSFLAGVPTLIAQSRPWRDLWPYLAVLLGCGCLVSAMALILASFCVRRRFGRLRFLLWLAAWAALGWAACFGAFIALIGGGPSWGELLVGILLLAGITLAMLLPLLLLSFFQPFYRARFLAWLNLPQPEPPVGVQIPPRLVEVAHVPPKP